MEHDRESKDKKVFKPRKPTCTGCLGDATPPTNQGGWCNGCWPAAPRPR